MTNLSADKGRLGQINLRRTAFHSIFPSLLLPGTQSSYYSPLLEPLVANQGVTREV